MDEARAGPARFDAALGAWILSRHEDVDAALREPRLAAGARGSGAALAARPVFGPDRTAAWRSGLERSARDLAMGLPVDRAVDLVAAFAAPWSLSAAILFANADPADAETLRHLAHRVFRAAAAATDAETTEPGRLATTELARRLPSAAAASDVQAFVALSQTLPHLLAGAWLALFADPAACHTLRARPDLTPRELDELLRRAGPSRAIFRRAVGDVRIGGARIAAGDRVVLMLAAANHDAACFTEPDHLDLDRTGPDHLTFGRGRHACPGARLVRLALAVATRALHDATTTTELAGPVVWLDGFAIRAPASLPVVLRRRTPADAAGGTAASM